MNDNTFYWNKNPGTFVNKLTGQGITLVSSSIGPVFTGSTNEWNETLIETIIDMRNRLSDGRNIAMTTLCVDRDTLSLLQNSVLYHKSKTGRPRDGGFVLEMKIKVDNSIKRYEPEVIVKMNDGTQCSGYVKILEDLWT